MDSVFVAPAGWSWDIILYFYFGGMAGGMIFLANVLRLMGSAPSLVPTRIAWYLGFPLISIGGVLLIKDLGRPERFWHMLIQSERVPLPIFQWWAPMSVGSWILTAAALFAAVHFLYALLEGDVIRWHRLDRVQRWLAPLHRPGLLGMLFLVGSSGAALLLAGYTGILLNNTNAPTWSQEPLLAPMFMSSGVASGGAAIFLLGHYAGAGSSAARHAVLRVALIALVIEAVLLAISVVLSLTHIDTATFFMGWWGVLFWLVILPLGVIAPIALIWSAEHRNRLLVRQAHVVGAALLLAGALLFRTLEVLGGQAYFRLY